MNSQTSLIARQTRIRQWAAQIQECNSRPKGMGIDEWCEQHGITKANYYYRLRIVRESMLAMASMASVPDFVELAVPPKDNPPIHSAQDRSATTAAILRTPQGNSLEILNSASAEMLHLILKEMLHAE